MTSPLTEDGGPAFPVPKDRYVPFGDGCGMSLRDYFAGQALAGMCHRVAQNGYPIGQTMETKWAAEAAYLFADAMLAARKGGTQ